MSRRSGFSLVVSAAGLIALGCGKEEPAAAPVIPSVMVTANGYAFQMPDTLPAGVTTFRLVNQGQELHHMTLVRLSEGQTVADFQKMAPNTPPPPGMEFMGGPNFAAPGGAVEATVELVPGRYGVICVIPAPDGQPHMLKGMVKELVVVPASSAGEAAVLPEPDVTVKLTDYAFEISKPLAAGRQVIRVENAGNQWHEMVFVKLNPGTTLEDALKWGEKPEGPPPFSGVDGTTVLSPGQSNTVTVELTAGDYALLCFLPDAKDGQPHLMKGMTQQIKIM